MSWKTKKRKENLMGWNGSVPAVDLKLFTNGFRGFCDAFTHDSDPERRTLGNPVLLVDGNGAESTIEILNSPFTRAIQAVSETAGNDFHKASATLMRIQALTNLLRHEKAKAWCVQEDSDIGLHPAVLQAAAVQPLPLKNDFPVFVEDSFFSAVQDIAKRMVVEAEPATARTQ
jgi:hypothetical protein